MTLISIVKKNILGNFKNYLIYFLSMIFSVVIYFTFVSLQYSDEIQKNIQSWDVLQSVFMQASILLILFVTVFILYSNSFFTRKRKKEVGLYSLLGVRKKTIGKMLFYENLLMGLFSIILGIILGTLFSKLFAMILLKLLGSTVNVHFSISIEAIINTTIVFMIIILFTSIQAYRMIYRFKLIELFHAERKGEQLPKAPIISASIAAVCIAFSYWIIFQKVTNHPMMNLLIFLVAIVVGTYLLFRSLIVFLLKTIQRNKSYYYKGINLIGISQLLYRMKGNARTLTMISLLSAVTLCAISIGYGDYYNIDKSTKNFSPFSYSYMSNDSELDRKLEKIIAEDKDHPVLSKLDIQFILVKGNLSQIQYVPYGFTPDNVPVTVIAESAYNQLAKALNRENNLQLKENQAAVIRPWQDTQSTKYVGHAVTLQLPKGNQAVHFVKIFEKRVLSWISPDINIIVSDELFQTMTNQITPISYKTYKVKNEKTTQKTSESLMNLAPKNTQIFTYYATYKKQLESSGIDIFLLGFLGLVFQAATGSIIYFKQLTEAHFDKERYDILKKIGVSKKEILKTIAKQTLFVFVLPFIIGILHSIIILKAIFGVNLTEQSIYIPIITAMSAYLMIYFGYYLLTVRSTNLIVNS